MNRGIIVTGVLTFVALICYTVLYVRNQTLYLESDGKVMSADGFESEQAPDTLTKVPEKSSHSSSNSAEESFTQNSHEDSKDEVEKILQLVEQIGYTEGDDAKSLVALFEFAENGFPTPTPQSVSICEMWDRKEYKKLVDLAESRLARDEKDMAGLLLKLELSLVYSNLSEYFVYATRVLQSTQGNFGTKFTEFRPILVLQIKSTASRLGEWSPDEYTQLKSKAASIPSNTNLKSAPLSIDFALKALEVDGQFALL